MHSQPELFIVDNFAGGGGASTGIEIGLGVSPDYAINHDEMALAMHEVNHPETRHLINDVWDVDPLKVTKGRTVDLAWFSPDCRHHSKAKGGKPVSNSVRDLAWVAVKWAKLVRPTVIMVENVEEFRFWGPLTAEDRPCPDRKGQTFESWVSALRSYGYQVEWKELKACDYGAPTIRKRLFVIARCDGQPIVWPEPTHGDPKTHPHLKPWKTAADIIDWSIPCPSIFDTSDQIKDKYGVRTKRPLADNTLKRIARGVMKYVVEAEEPFFVSYAQHGGRNRSAFDPLHTITASLKDQNLVVTPTLVQTGYGERAGQAPRALDIQSPIGTMVAGGSKHAVVAPSLVSVAHGYSGGRREYPIEEPIGTMSAGGTQHAVVSAFLAQHNGGAIGRTAAAPVSTLTTRATQQTVIAAAMTNLRGTSDAHLKGQDIREPVSTISAGGNHAGMIAAFLMKYYGTDQDPRITDPLHSLTTRDRFGLVTVNIQGEPYVMTDIGMRMLTPREQFRAQGFPDSYEIEKTATGKVIPKTQQTHKCGNSVCPPVVAALVSANVRTGQSYALAA